MLKTSMAVNEVEETVADKMGMEVLFGPMFHLYCLGVEYNINLNRI